MMVSVGTYEAKTKFSKLLKRVEAGESVIITRHGEAVAQLVPPTGKTGAGAFGDAVAHWRQTRRQVKLGGLKVGDLIDAGRR